MNLFDEFPGSSANEWQEKILADLKGKPVEEIESWTDSGIPTKPNYFDSENVSPKVFRESSSWHLATLLEGGSELNRLALRELSGGCNTLILRLKQNISPAALFDNIMLDLINCTVICKPEFFKRFTEAAESFLRHHYQQPVSTSIVCDCFGENPAGLVSENTLIDTAHYRDAGCTAVQENSFAFAHFADRLGSGATEVYILCGIGPDYFEEIARLRALRNGLGLIAQTYNWKGKFSLIGVPSSYYLSSTEINNNILRLTTMGMSSILGGCDQLTLPPFNLDDGPFTSRISRNIQLILEQESHLDKIIDPANGSYYLEYLYEAIGKSSWTGFQEIEAKGGIREYSESNQLQKAVDLSHVERLQKYAARKRTLLGVNKFKLKDADKSFFAPVERYGIVSNNLSQLIMKEEAL